MRKHFGFFALGISLTILVIIPGLHGQSAVDIGDLFDNLKWRCVGPAVMGGRTVGIDVVEKKPWIIYAAIGPSGVWKSDNNGVSWMPVFHEENTVSVGDIAVAQSHPNIIWVGTGEATCRNSVTIGDGAYKSTDEGKTWTNMGLKETRHISRIVINPGDPNIVYVAAMGHLWGPNKQRGVYKTIDGGKTWEKILYIDENTGIADLVMDPSDSLVLYAAAYEHRRLAYHFSSGGPGSGIYKTVDGGKTWKELTKDLPEGIKGRIGIDVSRSQPNVVYALIEHEDSGIWRSEDKGKTWSRTCDKETYERINFRPFYYSQIRIDPSDDRVVYVFSGQSYVSRDGGKKFRVISAGTHPDHHALWIDPDNPLHLIDGNDGGIDITYDGGKNWHSIQHMALAEVYQVGFDMRKPYYVYCGLQDNGTWGGPSAKLDSGSIINTDWYMVGSGDGFYAQVDPSDFQIVYGNSQMNGLYRYDMRIKKRKSIKPLASGKKPPYRFNWNSPVHISPHDPKTVYTGGNFLFKTTDGGFSWEIISPDLSTNDPAKQKDSGGPISPDNTGAEIHCTIVTISESPVEKGVIWCGTDDGNVQITGNGGLTWTNVVENILGLPPNTWCSRIEASRYDAGTAYAAFDGHRMDDYRTYLYKTTNYGETWVSLKNDLPFGWVHVIREDVENKNLLYVGTEFGIYASLDGGKSWFSLKNNLPTVAVRDIAVHPRDNDLIIGTHGRGIWILDDIIPLQKMTDQVLDSQFHLFPVRPVTQYFISSSGEPSSKPVYAAENPDFGMGLTVYLKEKPKKKPEILIRDADGKKVFESSLPTKKGLHQKTWNLSYVPKTKQGKVIKPTGIGLVSLPSIFPGEYSVELSVDEKTAAQTAIVFPDPRFEMSKDDKQAQIEAQVEVLALSKLMGLGVTAAKNIRRQLTKLEESLKEKSEQPAEVESAVASFQKTFQETEKVIVPKGFGYRGSMETALRGGTFTQQMLSLGMSIGGFPVRPTKIEMLRLEELKETVRSLINQLNTVIKKDLVLLNQTLEKHGLKPLRPPQEVKL
jgi:photosystem II stability/assembly factor-like uncharacterized protein